MSGSCCWSYCHHYSSACLIVSSWCLFQCHHYSRAYLMVSEWFMLSVSLLSLLTCVFDGEWVVQVVCLVVLQRSVDLLAIMIPLHGGLCAKALQITIKCGGLVILHLGFLRDNCNITQTSDTGTHTMWIHCINNKKSMAECKTAVSPLH